MTENASNNYQTTLNGAINSSVTSLVVTSATGAPAANFRIIIDSEIMLVTAVAGTTFTVTRGQESTTAASHSNGAAVAHIFTAASVPLFATERIATHTALPDAHHNQAHSISGADHTGTLGTTNYGNATVTYAKVQDVTAASRLLGRGSAAGAGSMQEIALGTNLSMSGTTLNATGGGGAVASDVIWDAKGDLAAGTGADTASKLTVGANDTILMADSAQTTGLKWAPAATTADIADVAAAEAAGTTDGYARADHTHAHASGYLPDAHHNQVHGAADHTDVTRTVYLNADEFNVVGPAAMTTYPLSGATNSTEIRAAALDSATTERIRMNMRVPDDWVSGGALQLIWLAAAPGAGSEAVKWSIDYLYAGDGSVATAAATNVTWTGTSATRAANELEYETAQTIATGAGAGKVLRLVVSRVGADGADTLTADAALLHVVFSYTASG